MLCFLPLLVACKKDQVQEEQNAVNFTAVIVPMGSEDDGSRVLPYDTWAGLSDRRVAVKIDGEIKAYSVDAEGNMTCEEPFFWNGRETVTVDAWYPYNGGERVETVQVKANQNIASNYVASDLVEVVQAEVKADKPSLSFVHRTAKLICRLTSFEDDFKTTLTVRGVTGVEGEGNSVVMTANYEALMAPQKIAEGALSLKFVVGDERSIVCQVPQGFEMLAGYCYYIDVEVGQDYVTNATYVGSSADWNTGTGGDIEGNSPSVNPGPGADNWNDEGTDGNLEGSSPEVTPDTDSSNWDGSSSEDVTGNSPVVKPGTDSPSWGEIEEDKIEGTKDTSTSTTSNE